MNTIGRIFRVSIFGESHGASVGVLVDGVPAGMPLSVHDFRKDLLRRKGGKFGTTKRIEDDIPIMESGVFEGHTTGTPILIRFPNKDTISKDYEEIRYIPRPGHADFTAYVKYKGFNDYRGGGHFSGRLTTGIVAAGVIAKKLIFPMKVHAYVEQIGGRCNDFYNLLKKAYESGDSLGGIVVCKVCNVPIGLGEPFFDSIESTISHAVFSIPGVKGIEFGVGFQSACMKGSEYNDQFVDTSGRTLTNNSGGINGGITNGNELVFRIAVRPTASISMPQQSFDIRTKEKKEIKISGRHDVCFALRVPPIVEAVTAITLADLKLISQSYNSSFVETVRKWEVDL